MSESKTFKKVKGVSNLYHRGDRYYARLSENGKQTWRSLDTDKITVARKSLNILLAGHGPEIKRRKAPTMHAAVGQVLEFRKTRRGVSRPLSPETLRYHGELLKLAKGIFPDRKITNFTKESIIESIAACGLSQSRRKALFELARGVFKAALESRQIEKNPLTGIVPEQVEPKERTLPTRKELQSLFKALEESFPKVGKAASLSARLLAFSGMRWSEARGLDWKHINGTSLSVEGLNGRVKTRRSRRKIHINKPLRATLDEIRAAYGGEGRVMPMRSILPQLTKACGDLNLAKVGHHDLRSWFATWCVTRGVDVVTVARWLGDDAGVVMRTYVQPTEEDMETAASRLI